MLIRAEQMTAFETAAEEKFVRRIASHLLEQYAQTIVRLPDDEQFAVRDLPEETLHSLIRHSIERARSYEMTFESSISAFIALRFEVSPNFDKHRLSQVMLKDETIEPDARLDELLETLTEKNWESVRGDYDVNAWQSSAAKESENSAEPKTSTETDKLAAAENLDFTETTANAEKPKYTVNTADRRSPNFDETMASFDNPNKRERLKDEDFLDTVVNIDLKKE